MIDCNDFFEFISAYYDGELSEPDCAYVQQHLDECENCSGLFEIYRDISLGTRSSLEPAPEALRRNVMDSILSGRADIASNRLKKLKLAGIISTRVVPLAACLALIIITLPRLVNPGRHIPDGLYDTPLQNVPATVSESIPNPLSPAENEFDEMAQEDIAVSSDSDDNSQPVSGGGFSADNSDEGAVVHSPGSGVAQTDSQRSAEDPKQEENTQLNDPPQTVLEQQEETENGQVITQDDAAPPAIVGESVLAEPPAEPYGVVDQVDHEEYVVFRIEGALPEVFSGLYFGDREEGTWYIVMPKGDAADFIAAGNDWLTVERHEIELHGEDKSNIIFWPGSARE